jgi:hypothetical protein
MILRFSLEKLRITRQSSTNAEVFRALRLGFKQSTGGCFDWLFNCSSGTTLCREK